jgi:NADH-quinone oxidoreductase subunit N
MTGNDILALSPLIISGGAAVLIMVVIAFMRSHRLALALTLIGLAAAFASLWLTGGTATTQVTGLLIVDGYARFFMGLFFAASFAVALLSYGYLARKAGPREEYYILLLLATFGSAVLASSSHFASFFLGLEILSVSLYALIAYTRASQFSVEAAIKYLVLAGASSAFLLFGMALIYTQTGNMQFSAMANLRNQAGSAGETVLLAGMAMLIVGFGFKLAVVPFHLWTPDVYEGAPAPVTAFVATVSKGGMFALLLRYFLAVDVRAFPSLFIVFAAIAVASMLVGNLLALLQNNVKRVLAYSSIAHLGYLLVAFLAAGPAAAAAGGGGTTQAGTGIAQAGIVAVSFYLTAYFVTTLAAFGVITVLSPGERDLDSITDYRGLYWRRPWSAGILSVALFSLAGLPLTAGFVGKFYIVTAAIGSTLWFLAIILVIGSAIGLFYYLRIMVTMFLQVEASDAGQLPPAAAPSLSWAGGIALAALLLAILWLGIYPGPLINLIQAAAGKM